MCINQGRFDAFMTQKFLDKPNIRTLFNQMRGVAVAQSMHRAFFVDFGFN